MMEILQLHKIVTCYLHTHSQACMTLNAKTDTNRCPFESEWLTVGVPRLRLINFQKKPTNLVSHAPIWMQKIEGFTLEGALWVIRARF